MALKKEGKAADFSRYSIIKADLRLSWIKSKFNILLHFKENLIPFYSILIHPQSGVAPHEIQALRRRSFLVLGVVEINVCCGLRRLFARFLLAFLPFPRQTLPGGKQGHCEKTAAIHWARGEGCLLRDVIWIMVNECPHLAKPNEIRKLRSIRPLTS